jgi:hypothetical protein
MQFALGPKVEGIYSELGKSADSLMILKIISYLAIVANLPLAFISLGKMTTMSNFIAKVILIGGILFALSMSSLIIPIFNLS